MHLVGIRRRATSLAQATVYLALAPKSNSPAAYFRPRRTCPKGEPPSPPTPCKTPDRDRAALGHGQDYRYPHDYPGHFVDQEYLPDELAGTRFYDRGRKGPNRSW